MREFFEISGHYIDDNTQFRGIVTNYDDVPDETYPYGEDDIFLYGVSENNLKEAIEEGRNTIHDFVITNYKKL